MGFNLFEVIGVQININQTAHLMKYVFVVLLLLVGASSCIAQQLQIVSPAEKVVTSLSEGDFTTLRTFGGKETSGQITRLTVDSLILNDRGYTYAIRLHDIAALRKSTKSGASLRRIRGYSGLAAIAILPANINPERSFGATMLSHAAVMIPTTLAIFVIFSGRPLRKVKKGYSYKVVEQ